MNNPFGINDVVRMITTYSDAILYVCDEPYIVIKSWTHGCEVQRLNGLPLTVGTWKGRMTIHFVPWAIRKDVFLSEAKHACADA